MVDSTITTLGRRFEYLNPGNDRHKLLVTSNAKKRRNVHAFNGKNLIVCNKLLIRFFFSIFPLNTQNFNLQQSYIMCGK